MSHRRTPTVLVADVVRWGACIAIVLGVIRAATSNLPAAVPGTDTTGAEVASGRPLGRLLASTPAPSYSGKLRELAHDVDAYGGAHWEDHPYVDTEVLRQAADELDHRERWIRALLDTETNEAVLLERAADVLGDHEAFVNAVGEGGVSLTVDLAELVRRVAEHLGEEPPKTSTNGL